MACAVRSTPRPINRALDRFPGMSALSYIRFATYPVCAAAIWLADQPEPALPVHLFGPKEADALQDRARAARAAATLSAHPDLRDTHMSGRQVVGAAIAAATRGAGDLKDFGAPHLSLSRANGHLLWLVSFYQTGGPPGAFFGVTVDDETGATRISPGR